MRSTWPVAASTGERAADLGAEGEAALHRRQPVGHVLGDGAIEEIGAGDARWRTRAGGGRRQGHGRRSGAVRSWRPVMGGGVAAVKGRPMARPSRSAVSSAAMDSTGDGILDQAEKAPAAARIAVRRGGASARRLVDLALPPQCLACHAPVAEMGTLCPACWSRLKLIERPYCERLGIPFAYDLGPGALVGRGDRRSAALRPRARGGGL